MAQNKKHHYVPRFYLKRFSRDRKSINLWNLATRKGVLSANLKNQCYKNYFYGKDRDAEAALGGIEEHASHLFEAMDQLGFPPPAGSDGHLLLVVYVLMQHARTQYFADTLNEMQDRMFKQLFRFRAEAEGVDLQRVTIKLKEPGLLSLGLASENFPLLLDLDYKLVRNASDVEFIASDNPVVFYNQLFSFRRFGSNTGLASKGLQIFFPISPRDTILFFDDTVYSVGVKKNPTVIVSQPRDVYELNALQMCSANENIYFRDETLNIDRLYRKAAPFRRHQKSTLRVFPGKETEDQKEELLATSREDIRTNLNLSFVRITRRARKWREEFQKLKPQPVVVVRNRQILDYHKEFLDKVKSNECQLSDFFDFLQAKADKH